MSSANAPRFDHGAALRVPPMQDAKNWRALSQWLGDAGGALDPSGTLKVRTAAGWAKAWPGDWIVLSVSGEFHVAHSGGAWDA